MIRRMVSAVRISGAIAAVAALFGAPAAASEEAARNLAALKGFKAVLEARDHVAGRSFGATIVYRYPDRALATLPPDDFIHLEGGRLTVREGATLKRADVGGWLRGLQEGLAPALAGLAMLEGGPAGAPLPVDFARSAGRLGTALEIDMRRSGEKVSIALVLTPACDLAAERAPGFRFEATGGVEVARAAGSGFPESIVLRGPLGRVEGEVKLISFEVLAEVPDASLALPAGGAAPEAAEPSPVLKERIAALTLDATLERIRGRAAGDPALLDRDEARVSEVLAAEYAALYRAAYPEKRLREEARRAVVADLDAVKAALADAAPARRGEVVDALIERFRQSCRRQLRDALGELVRIAEAALEPRGAEGEAVRRKLLAASGKAAMAAFERAIVAPMEDEARAEVERIAKGLAPGDAPAARAPSKGDKLP